LPVYLALFLNSPAGRAQSEQAQTGSSGQIEIYPTHITKFLVMLPRQRNGAVDIGWQRQIVAKIDDAVAGRAASAAKVDHAKLLVDAALNG
jgi:hypothetical protein